MKYSLPLLWQHFNFQHDEIEKEVSSCLGSYHGLTSAALYTDEDDLLSIFSHPDITGTFVDLGCGVGKASVMYALLFPERSSLGIEFQVARLEVAKKFQEKFQLTNLTLLSEDLLTCSLPTADFYFLYFPTGPVLDRILCELYSKNQIFKLIVIESHGDLFPRIDLENWLTLVDEIPLKGQRHHPMARIYQRNMNTREICPAFLLSFTQNYLLISDGAEDWLGESFGLEWTSGSKFELLHPPRTINWENVKNLMPLAELNPIYHLALALRPTGEVEITTFEHKFSGIIRKIIVVPTFHLELSSGEKVEWESIITISQGSQLCYVRS